MPTFKPLSHLLSLPFWRAAPTLFPFLLYSSRSGAAGLAPGFRTRETRAPAPADAALHIPHAGLAITTMYDVKKRAVKTARSVDNSHCYSRSDLVIFSNGTLMVLSVPVNLMYTDLSSIKPVIMPYTISLDDKFIFLIKLTSLQTT